MPRAEHTHPSCLKVNHRYLPRCLALILFTCCLTSLAFPPGSGSSGGPSLGQMGADLAQALAAADGGCSGRIFGAAPVTVGTNPRSVAVGDFNADGKGDLAVANYGSNDVSILLSNGDGSFQTAVNYRADASPNSFAVGDFNGDGKPDLGVANADSNNVSILLGNGNGTFQTAARYSSGSSPSSLAVGDFNGDGKPDLAVANQSKSGTVSILLGNGNGTFQAAVDYAAGSFPGSVAVADFNGDGRADLALTSSSGVSILLGNGNGTFQTAVNYAAGFAPYSVAVGDFNEDGKPDLAVVNQLYPAGAVSILLGNGNGTFKAAISHGLNFMPLSLTVGDFNGDGKPDLAVTNYYFYHYHNTSNVSILLGNGNGTFQTAVTYGSGSSPYSVALGDFNGDRKPDLAVANSASNNVSILLGNGNGTFQAVVRYSDVGGQSVAVGDFNGDGKPDLAVLNANYPAATVSILLGNGDGSFQSPTRYGAGGLSYFVTVGDFNADGKLDLVVANAASHNLSILLGNGDGSFQAATLFVAGSNPVFVAVEDFNGDGKPDLAVANAGSNSVSILLGYGNGTFQTAVSYGAGSSPRSVTLGDFNGDGKLDLAVAASNNVSILLGNGNGTFQTAVSYGADSAWSVAVGDFNGDGNSDLAIVSNNVSILLGNGNGTFQAAISYGVGSWPGSLAVADFNGDGKPDLAVTDPMSNDVSILLNASTCTAIPGKATLVSPSGNIATTTPKYVWNAVAGATWFYLWVNSGMVAKIQQWYTAQQAGCSSGRGTCSVSPSTTLATGLGQWWIQTWNDAGYGPWSDGMSFIVSVGGPPGKVVLVSSFGSVSTNTSAYTWNAVASATWYQLWVNDSSTITGKVKSWYTAAQARCASGTGTCSVTPATALAAGSAQWWIQTWNDSGYGPWSDGMSFSVGVAGARER